MGGARQKGVPERLNSKRNYRKVEKNVAISPRSPTRIEKGQGGAAARGGGEDSRRDPILTENEARARISWLRCERSVTGVDLGVL